MERSSKPPLGTPLRRNDPLNVGLTGFWPLWEGSGRLCDDITGDGWIARERDVSWDPRLFWTGGRSGGFARFFDGTNDVLELTGLYMPSGVADPYTVSFWFRTSATGDRAIWAMYNSAGSAQRGLIRIQQTDKLGLWHAGTNVVVSTVGVCDGRWHHGLVVKRGNGTNETELWLDGRREAVGTNNNYYDQSAPIRIGGLVAAGNYFGGAIEDVRFWKGRALSVPEIQRLYAAPWSVFEPDPIWLWVSGGGAAALEGSALAVATATGALSTQIPLQAAATASATASGELTTSIRFEGSALAAAAVSAALSTGINLAGAAGGTGAGSGALSTGVNLAGAAQGQGIASATLTTQIPLQGAAAAVAAAMAQFEGGVAALEGQAAGAASASGAITTGIPLQGAAVVAASASGDLSTAVRLAGVAVAASTASGALTVEIRLTGAALAGAIAAGGLSAQITLSGAAQGDATAGGGLTTQIPLAGTAAGDASASGSMDAGAVLTVNPAFVLRSPHPGMVVRARHRAMVVA